MFICDDLIYVQLQKTGCTHIALLLSKLFEGAEVGKHHSATPAHLESGKYVISSIRNPWHWYLSLWSFGIQGKGAVMHQLTRRRFGRALKWAVRNPGGGLTSLSAELTKDVGFWRDVYGRGDNPEAFRSWLKRVLDPSNGLALGEGYGEGSTARLCGLMTYRYLRLCCLNADGLGRMDPGATVDDLRSFDRENCYVDFFIRLESLQDDLCRAVTNLRPLSGEEVKLIHGAGKTNASKRRLTESDYYDAQCVALVGDRDRLLIEKFGYAAPVLG